MWLLTEEKNYGDCFEQTIDIPIKLLAQVKLKGILGVQEGGLSILHLADPEKE